MAYTLSRRRSTVPVLIVHRFTFMITRTTRSVSKGGNTYIPKGPDGTKGFSSEYQARRTTFPATQPPAEAISG